MTKTTRSKAVRLEIDRRVNGKVEDLTKMRQIVPLIVAGKTGQEISKHFGISIASYWRYLRAIRKSGLIKIPPLKRGRRLMDI